VLEETAFSFCYLGLTFLFWWISVDMGQGSWNATRKAEKCNTGEARAIGRQIILKFKAPFLLIISKIHTAVDVWWC